MAVKVHGELTGLQVKAKKKKERGEGGVVYETVERIGRLTLEFDADGVDVSELGKMVNGRYITLELEDPQLRFSAEVLPDES